MKIAKTYSVTVRGASQPTTECAELSRLIAAANKVCEREEGRRELVVLRWLSVR